jgi:hypothetical protein
MVKAEFCGTTLAPVSSGPRKPSAMVPTKGPANCRIPNHPQPECLCPGLQNPTTKDGCATTTAGEAYGISGQPSTAKYPFIRPRRVLGSPRPAKCEEAGRYGNAGRNRGFSRERPGVGFLLGRRPDQRKAKDLLDGRLEPGTADPQLRRGGWLCHGENLNGTTPG